MSAWDDAPAVGGSSNTWDSGPAVGGSRDWQATAPTSGGNDAFNSYGGGDTNDFGGDAGGGSGGDRCRNCGQDGHFARGCPKPRKNSSACYNCGEEGHNKADCPNEAIERPFDGDCRVCGKVGHRAAACHQKPADICRSCGTEGHKAADCEANRRIDRSKDEDMTKEEAWAKIIEGVKDRDMGDAKKAINCYVKADDSITYVQLEQKFRKADIDVYCIAQEIEIAQTLTLVNLQGKGGCKYSAGYFFSPKPKRKIQAKGWPRTPKENLERLADAGISMENFVPLCRNCNELGHVSKACPQDKVEPEKVQVTCTNCQGIGHRMRDCHEERVQRGKEMNCRKCGDVGHMAKDCPNAPAGESGRRACYNCGSESHMSRECTKPRKITCRNCNKEGHVSKECDKPREPSTVNCHNCGQTGHFAKDCTEKKDWSKVTCQNCSEVGHGRNFKGCKMYGQAEGGDGFSATFGGFGATTVGGDGAWAATDNTGSAW